MCIKVQMEGLEVLVPDRASPSQLTDDTWPSFWFLHQCCSKKATNLYHEEKFYEEIYLLSISNLVPP